MVNLNFLTILLSLFFFQNINVMESCPEENIASEKFSEFETLPNEIKLTVLLKDFENIVKKQLSNEENIRLLFRLKSDLLRTNKLFNSLINENKTQVFKKFAEQLLTIFNPEDLNNLWRKYYDNEEVAAVLLFAGAQDISQAFAGTVDINLGIKKIIESIINKRDALKKTIQNIKNKFDNLKNIRDLNEAEVSKQLATEFKAKYRSYSLQQVVRDYLNNPFILDILIKAGININAGFLHGETPLILAARDLYVDTIKFLIDQKMDVNQQDFLGHTPLTHVIVSMVKKIDPQNPSAPTYEHADPIKKQIAVDMLLKAGAKPNLRTKKEKTPLDFARELNLKEIEKILLQHGAKSGAEFVSPLMVASRSGNIREIKYLINEGVNINEQNNVGQTALMFAVGSEEMTEDQKRDTVKLLLNAGANVNIKDQNGKTVLEYATEKNLKDIYQLLFKSAVMSSGYIKTY